MFKQKEVIESMAITVAMSVCISPVFALEAMDDESLSAISGQEGITIDQTSYNTIEEFVLLDGDGDGSGPGRVNLNNWQIGNFRGLDLQSNTPSTNNMLTVTGKTIDATSDGVIITEGHIESQGGIVINDAGQYVYDNFTKPTQTVAKIPSVWKAQLGLRYRF